MSFSPDLDLEAWLATAYDALEIVMDSPLGTVINIVFGVAVVIVVVMMIYRFSQRGINEAGR